MFHSVSFPRTGLGWRWYRLGNQVLITLGTMVDDLLPFASSICEILVR